ncbi:glycosyltransferase family 25 protein [Coniochaeta sp. 2T2.1]|nr:glycosyltransferase family 25 protein [Coniochaeta sp. 2T2.1]
MTLAGAVTGLKFDWVDGVAGTQVHDRVLPPDSLDSDISKGNIGSWRAHMNALRTVVEQNLSTALILEDDIDWDIRLKHQLQNFSLATRHYLHHTSSPSTQPPKFNTLSLPSLRSPPLSPPHPYGRGWDVLWLGHCGTSFPSPIPPSSSSSSSPSSSALRVSLPNDHTVPSHANLRPHPFALPDAELISSYPPHTRVIHAPGLNTTCTQSYAVSHAGARKLLYKFGTESFTKGWDLMLGEWCAGVYSHGQGRGAEADGKKGRREAEGEEARCITVQPPLFAQHYGRGGASDITAPGGGYIDRGREMTPYVRLSVRLNMGRLVRGDGEGELEDQWPD